MQFDREKFKALVLYVIWRTGDVRNFGATKLNKVLWFSDARTFEAMGMPVTGETYIRRQYGPVPQHINEILDELAREGQIQAWTDYHFDLEVKRYSATGPPDSTTICGS